MGDRTSGRLLVRGGTDQAWRAPEVTRYRDERALQDLIMETPSLLPGVDVAAVAAELYLPGTGSVDLVAVEPAGNITLVECKLADNPEIRRAVVGQILAYAGALWRMSYEDFDQAFRNRSGRALAEAVAEHAGDGWDEEAFRTEVTSRLESGSFRLVIAVDEVTDELKRIIEFLNLHTAQGLEVLGFEAAYVSHASLEILIPHVHGEETARVKTAGRREAQRWAEADLFAPSKSSQLPRGSPRSDGCSTGRPIAAQGFDGAPVPTRRSRHSLVSVAPSPPCGPCTLTLPVPPRPAFR